MDHSQQDRAMALEVARRVAEAAMQEGVSRLTIDDLDAYEQNLLIRIARANGRA